MGEFFFFHERFVPRSEMEKLVANTEDEEPF